MPNDNNNFVAPVITAPVKRSTVDEVKTDRMDLRDLCDFIKHIFDRNTFYRYKISDRVSSRIIVTCFLLFFFDITVKNVIDIPIKEYQYLTKFGMVSYKVNNKILKQYT